MTLPGDDMPLPETDDRPLFGSGFSFLNAPSAVNRMRYEISHVKRECIICTWLKALKNV